MGIFTEFIKVQILKDSGLIYGILKDPYPKKITDVNQHTSILRYKKTSDFRRNGKNGDG